MYLWSSLQKKSKSFFKMTHSEADMTKGERLIAFAKEEWWKKAHPFAAFSFKEGKVWFYSYPCHHWGVRYSKADELARP